MSISGALANALTGLTAVGRRGEVVSANVANAMTEGYARREIDLVPQALGGNGAGVRVRGVERIVSQSLLQSRRLSDAELQNSDTRSAFLSRIAAQVGQPGEAGALTTRLSDLESALIEAESRPDSTPRLATAVTAARDLAAGLNRISADIQAARSDADDSIAAQVGRLNDYLARVDGLNTAILTARASGQDANALLDQRQSLVDGIAQIVPVREMQRDRDQIALFTTGGAVLLEGNPARIGFSPVSLVTADMTLAGGALSGLTLNGIAIDPSDGGIMGGGSLSAAFAVRDEAAPVMQGQIDAMARDLIERFAAPGVDPTLATGQPGLLTDAGAVLDPLNEVGLAGRIRVNALADPDQGGQLWRLRDGLGAAAAGPVGDGTLLQALTTALGAVRVPASGTFGPAARTASGLAADFVSQIASETRGAADRQAYAIGRQSGLKELELQNGVDTDAEMQTLLQVEQAYAANARVIQTMDDLIQQLIGL